MAANIGNRISELIGEAYSTVPANSKVDLINAAIGEVADILPTDLLLKYCEYDGGQWPRQVTSSGHSLGNDNSDKIFLVVRRESNDADAEHIECTAVPYPQFLRAKKADSIYYATKFSPIYSYVNRQDSADGVMIKFLPDVSVTEPGYIYGFTYPTTDLSSSTFVPGLPPSVMQAVVLKASINILRTYISDFVQDEEDAELQQMIEAQSAGLEKQYQQEMGRYMEQDATPRGE
tara:strand:+ start:6796 stop:7494 length:699 start_codon:yes stop_codon:yes gene_type:complete